MDEKFILMIQTALNTQGIKTDFDKLKQMFEKDPAKINTVMDMSATKTQINKFIKEYAPKLQEVFSKLGVNVDTKSIESSLKSVFNETEKSVKQVTIQQQKLVDAMAKGREQSELQSKAEKERQNLAQNNAINKSQQQEYIQQQKILEKTNQIKAAMSTSSVNSSVSNATTQYQKLSNVTTELEADFKQLILLQTALGNSTTDEELISNYEKFNTVLAKVSNQTKVLNNEQNSAKQSAKELQNSYKLDESKTQTFNKIGSYISNNSKLTKTQVSSLKELQNAISDVNDKSGLDQIKTKFRTVTSEAEKLGKVGDTTFTKLKKNTLLLANYLGTATIIMTGVNSVKNLISTVTELDASLVDLQMATGYSNQQAKELLNTYIDMGQQLGATGTEVSAAANDYLRQGKSVSETNELIKDSMVLSKLGSIESSQATEYLTTAYKGYGVAVSDVIGIVDKLSAVDMISATSAGGLAEAMSQTATNANLAGVSMDKLLGYLAVTGETTGEAMSAVGNSFSTMFSRMANIKLKSLSDPEAASDLNNVETALGNVDIKLRSNNKTFREFDDVLDDVSGKWSTLSEVNQRAIAVSIAGKDHMEDFLVLMQNYAKAQEYTAVASESSGTAMEKFGDYEVSVEAKTKTLQASLQGLATDTLDSSVVKSFLDVSNVLVNVVDKFGLFNIILTATVGVLGAKGILPLIPAVSKVLVGLGTSLGLAGEGAGILVASLSAMLPVIAGLAAIAGITALYDYFNVTLEENQEILAKHKELYDTETSNIESLKTELQECKDKLEELNEVGGATVVKDGEQEKLEAQTDELQRQLDIATEKQRIEGLETEKAATSSLGSTIKSKYKIEYLDTANTIESPVNVTQTEELQNAMEAHDRYKKIVEEATIAQQKLAKEQKGNTPEWNKQKKIIEEYSKKMEDTRAHTNELAVAIDSESSSIIGTTKAGVIAKKTADDQLNGYDAWINGLNEVSEATDGVTDSQDELAEATESAFSSKSNMVDSINKMKSGFEQIQSIYDDIKDGEDFDFSSLDSSEFTETFAGMDEDVSDFIDTLSQYPNDMEKCQTATENLVNAMLSNSDMWNNLDESTASVAKNMLESLGVINADDLVNERLSGTLENNADEAENLAEQFDVLEGAENALASEQSNLSSSTDSSNSALANQYSQLLGETDASGMAKIALVDLIAQETIFSNSTLDVSQKLVALQTLATAAFGAQAALSMGNSVDYGTGGVTPEKAWKNQVEKMAYEQSKTQAKIQAKYSSPTVSKSSSGGSSKKDTSAADAQKEALEAQKKVLEAQKEILEDIKDDMDGALSAVNKRLEENISLVEDQKQAAEDAIQSEIDGLEEAKDALQDQIDAKNKEIDAINDASDARQREIDLEQAKYDLERSMSQRTKAVLQNGQKEYTVDTTSIRENRETLSDAEDAQAIANIEEEISSLEDAQDALTEQQEALEDAIDASNASFDVQIDKLNAYKDSWSDVSSAYEDSQNELLAAQLLGADWEEQILSGRTDVLEAFKEKYMSTQAQLETLDLKIDSIETLISNLNDASSTMSDAADSMSSSADKISSATDGMNSALSDTSASSSANGIKTSADDTADSVTNLSSTMDEASGKLGEFGESVGSLDSSGVDGITSSILAFSDALSAMNTALDGMSGGGISDATSIAGSGETSPTASIGGGGISSFISDMQQLTDLSTKLQNVTTQLQALTAEINAMDYSALADSGTNIQTFADGITSLQEQMTTFASTITEACSQIQLALSSVDFASFVGSESGGGKESEGDKTSTSKGTKEGTSGSASAGIDTGDGSSISAVGTAITSMVAVIQEQSDTLSTVLQGMNESFQEQVRVITEEYIPAWQKLDTDLNTSINGGGNSSGGSGDSGGKSGGEGSEGSAGGIVGTIQTGGENAVTALKEVWLTGFEDVAYNGDPSIKTICDEIITMMQQMADKAEEMANKAIASARKASTAIAGIGTGGGSNYGGNANVNGTANASGTWGAKESGETLLGELGQEIVVDPKTGRWETIGTNGAEFADIKKGDIVFNHKQTEELLKNGKIISRGKALADGQNNFSLSSFNSMMPNLINTVSPFTNTSIPNYSNITTSKQSSTTQFQFGDIKMYGVNDVDSFSKILVSEMQNRVTQELHKK